MEPLTLHDTPLLEGRLVQTEAVQQVSLVEERDPLEGCSPTIGEPGFEIGHVHGDDLRIERDGVALRQEPRWFAIPQRPAQAGQRLAKALPGLRLRRVPPQQGRQLVTGVKAPDRQRQIGEQRPEFARRQHARSAVVEAGGEPTEELDTESRHRPGHLVRTDPSTVSHSYHATAVN